MAYKKQKKFKLPKTEIFLLLVIIFMNISFFGANLNFEVISSNGGKMPVYTNEYNFSNKIHFTYSDIYSVKKYYLTDIIPIGNIMISLGDVFIFAGVIGVLICMIKYTKIRF